jgi:hypothetical protein
MVFSSLVLFVIGASVAVSRDAAADPLFAAPFLSFDTGTKPWSVAIADLNADGRPDLAVANQGSNTVSVLLGNGDGRFLAKTDFGTGGSPRSVAIGDLNGDGRPDLAVANQGSNTVSVLLGNGDGTFGARTDHGTGSWPSAVAVGDFNGDLDPDLATANANSNTVSVLLGNGDGTFEAKTDFVTGGKPYCVAIGDLNGDGHPDLATANNGQNVNTVSVLLGDGNGAFGVKTDFVTGPGPNSVAIGDLNGDSKPDLVASYWADLVFLHTVSVLLGNGDGTFGAKTDYGAGGEPNSVAIGDLNGDGKPELVVANAGNSDNFGNTVSVLLGNGDGTFGATTDLHMGDTPYSVAMGDLNGDSRPDLVTPGSSRDRVSVRLGNGDGTFGAKANFGTGIEPHSVAIADLNGDGKPDLTTANSNPYPTMSVSVLLGSGDGTFGAMTNFGTGSYPRSVAIGDLNGDGKPDLATANFGNYLTPPGTTVSVLLGNGDGTFGTKTDFGVGVDPRSVAIGDLNGDTKPDLAVANYSSNTVSVLLGNGAGSFGEKTDFGTGINPRSVAIGDLNGDTKPDLAVANYSSNTVSVLLGNGDGTFAPKADFGAGMGTASVAIGDLNGDGRPDLATANRAHTVSVLLGNGDGTFAPKADFGAGMGPASVAIGDLNGDGKPDLATANCYSGTVSVLLNLGSTPTGVGPATSRPPGTFQLLASRPNPSRGMSEIRFLLPSACTVDVTLFDLAGRKVRSLAAGERSTPGEHSVRWDGRDASGAPIRDGVYLVQVRAGRNVGVRKLIVLR